MMRSAMKTAWLIERINALPYRVLFLFWGGNVFLFTCIYTTLSYIPGNGPTGLEGPLMSRFANSLYYSVITATNTGYGDIVPLGYSRIFAALQSVTELFLFALFVSKLVSSRGDAALEEVHKLSFELTFHNIREDFYVARKDFDLIINTVRSNKTLMDADWERLEIAYQHIGSLLNEVPNFYDVTSDLYIIDPRREVLLLEAVQRTTTRINDLIKTMKQARIDWMAHKGSLAELSLLVKTLDGLIPLWQKHSRDQSHSAFITIADSLESMQNLLKN